MTGKNESIKERTSLDINASGDSTRVLESLNSYENADFGKSTPSSDGGQNYEELDPAETAKKLGSDMSDLFTEWCTRFLRTKQYEDEILQRMDDLKKQAYMLEAEFLERKLELVKKRFTD